MPRVIDAPDDVNLVLVAHQAAIDFPKPSQVVYSYGTAGFRTKADILPSVLVRVGLLSAVRSMHLGGRTVGVMITASHNPEEDNGVKIVDPMGEMLESAWERHATRLANAEDDAVGRVLREIVMETGTEIDVHPNAVFARDTRPSGPLLVRALIRGLEALKTAFVDYGELTTPQLHYMVRCINTTEAYGTPTEDGYFDKFSRAFRRIMGAPTKHYEPRRLSMPALPRLYIDCANGIGGPKLRKLIPLIADVIDIRLVNDGTGRLNHNCGADHVKVQQRLPENILPANGDRCASVDGDADRLVYFFTENGQFRLLDGDRIAALFASFIGDRVRKAGLSLHVGVVQTAYANGGSTKYLTGNLGLEVACVETGVKYLHHRAVEFDVGVYFEANGHGTVVFSDRAIREIAGLQRTGAPDRIRAIEDLQATVELINQAVGDAITDLLLVEAILARNVWTLGDWYAQYSDLPNRQLKVQVKDRTVIRTTDAERRCVAPAALQPEIDRLVALRKDGRSFARPSGTEDVVRVYAEAATQEMADSLALDVARAVFDFAGGVGKRP